MACVRKEITGFCSHFQCPYPEVSGYECVDLIKGKYCEVGDNCPARCSYTFPANMIEEVISLIED